MLSVFYLYTLLAIMVPKRENVNSVPMDLFIMVGNSRQIK